MLTKQVAVDSLGPVQTEIMLTVVESPETDYSLLTSITESFRTDLVDSTKSLREKKLIVSVPVDPKNKRSRVIFTPTEKGLCYTIHRLSNDPAKTYDRYMQTKHAQVAKARYSQFIPNHAHQKRLFLVVTKVLLEKNLFDNEGMILQQNKDDRLRLFMEVARIIRDDLQIGPDIISSLVEICSKEMLRHIRDSYKEADKQLHKYLSQFDELERKGLL